MALAKKHLGFSKWAVFEDGVKIAGPMTKAEAEARMLAPPPKPDLDAERAWLKRLASDLAAPVNEEAAEILAVLLKRRTPDVAASMMRAIDPIQKAGAEAGRRERTRFLPAAKAA